MDPLLDSDASHRIAGSGSPVVSDIDSSKLLRQLRRNRYDALMGGDSFEKRYIYYLQYFSENPEKKIWR